MEDRARPSRLFECDEQLADRHDEELRELYGRGGNRMGFGPPVTPQVIKNIMIANAVVFVAQMMTSDTGLVTNFGSVRPSDVWQHGQFWQPFTYMWLHSTSSLTHILFNMLALWMFGSSLALHWGDQRFLRYYLTCGFGAGFLIATMPYVAYYAGFESIGFNMPTLGASGAVYGVLLAFSFTWPDRTIMLIFPPIPIKALWLIPLLFFMEQFGPPNVSTTGHLGGVIVGWIYLLNEGKTPGAPTLQSLGYRWRRYKMRRRLRAVKMEEETERDRWRNNNRSNRSH